MTKNNDGRLDHCDPIPDFIKSGIYRVFNFIFLFLFFCTCHSKLEVLCTLPDLVFVRVLLLLDRTLDDHTEDDAENGAPQFFVGENSDGYLFESRRNGCAHRRSHPFLRKSAPTGFPEDGRLVFGCDDLEQISFVTAAIEASASFGILDKFKFARLDLQGVHIFLGIDLTCVEQKLVCRDGKQRLCEFPDRRNQKILDILTCQNHRGVLFAHTLHAVAQIFDCSHVG